MAEQLCYICGNYCRSTLNMCPTCNPKPGRERKADSLTGGRKAAYMARYSHRPWVAWKDKSGAVRAAHANPVSLGMVLADIGRRRKARAVLYTGDQCGMAGGPAMVRIWLANAKAGCLS